MTILYPAPAPVKSARPFGAGLLAARPTHRAPYTAGRPGLAGRGQRPPRGGRPPL